MKKRFHIVPVLAAAALVCCGVLAAVCSVPTAYEAPFELAPLAVITAVLALAVTAVLVPSKRRWWIPLLIFLGLIAFYGWRTRSYIRTGAEIVRYSALRLLSLSFSFLPTPAVPAEAPYPEFAVTLFLILVAGVLAALTAVLVTKVKSPVPAMLLPVPAFVLCFIYTDCQPALFAIALLVIYWVGLLFGRGLASAGEERKAGAAKTIFVLLLAGLAALVPVLSPRESFTPIPYSERKGFIDAFGSFGDRMFSHKTDIPSEYDLTKEGMREQDESKAFSVNSSVKGGFTLRTHSYGRYNGWMWQSATEYKDSWTSLEALGRTQTGKYAQIFIRDAYMTERLTPYGFLHDDEVAVGESSIRANGRTAYTWTFLPEAELTPVVSTSAEKRYYEFALEHYTMRSGAVKQRMLKLYDDLLREKGLSSQEPSDTGEPNDPYLRALSVARLVRDSGTYTLTPGVYPNGVDFVGYFLAGNRKGYCVHFASATTAILQAMGIPARYVIGYRVEITEANTWTEVPESASHAWTEVYIKGAGWVPVESSAGFPVDTAYSPGEPAETSAPNTETDRPDTTLPPWNYTFPPENTPVPTPKPTKRPVVVPDTTQAPSPGETGGLPLKWLRPIPIVLVGALAVWEAVGAVIKKRRERRFRQEDAKAAVLEMLGYLASIRKYGAVEPENRRALANEAAFSNHPMLGERDALLELVRKNQAELSKDKPFRRFLLKWLLFRI